MLRYLSVGRQRARLIAGCVSLAGCVATERSLPIAPPPSNMVLSAAVPEYSAAVPEMAIDPRDPRRIAVIWRYLSMDGINQERQRHFECHLSLSSDGGRTFSQQRLEWDSPQTPVCNSPFVDIGSRGELMIGATLAGVLPQGVPPGTHADGKVGMRLSHDWGRSWTATQSLIASDHGDRFVPNPAVPIEATKVPWDGGRGMIDATTGAIVLTGGFPAPPGEQQHSQRFFTVSHDSGRQWGPIRAWTATGWPQRWDGTMITAHGKLAIAYLAAAVPMFPGIKTLEGLIGIMLVTNRFVPLALVLEVPTSITIFYINFVVVGEPRQLLTGPLEIGANAALLLAYYRYYRPFLVARAYAAPPQFIGPSTLDSADERDRG